MARAFSAVLLATIALAGAGCGEIAEVDGLKRPVPRIGRGPEYRFEPAGPAAAAGRRVAGLRCTGIARDRFGAHLEVFVNRLDVVIPAGIGAGPPHPRDGAYGRGGAGPDAARPLEPTGLIEVDAGRELTLGQFFDLWGQPLSRT